MAPDQRVGGSKVRHRDRHPCPRLVVVVVLWAGEGVAAVLSWSSCEPGQGDIVAWPLTVVDICELRRV
jgi:hypothetical protein